MSRLELMALFERETAEVDHGGPACNYERSRGDQEQYKYMHSIFVFNVWLSGYRAGEKKDA